MAEVSKEYGTALFMLACEEQKQEEYAAALQTVETAFAQNEGFLDMLCSPSIPLAERLGVIDTVFVACLPNHMLSYVKLLCEKGRLGGFCEAAEAYRALLDASRHVANVTVTSAVELTDDEKQKLTKKLEQMEKGRVRADYIVDESVLGGLVVEIDGRILDGSLRHRLQEVKEVMNT